MERCPVARIISPSFPLLWPGWRIGHYLKDAGKGRDSHARGYLWNLEEAFYPDPYPVTNLYYG
ncbi:MAG TPA: hypothetical protein VMW09_08060 [Desulfatiglandales bacterium]|nr:hypothetical protein [Desulfatiglandales bacterium]